MTPEEYKFQKLTPVHDADLNVYKDALDFVFKNQDIRNVAISGAYSAGKSSVIETYEKTHSQTRFLHISLAYFEPTNTSESSHLSSESCEISENILEGKILNQLIHQIDPSKIPQTNFRVKRHVSKKASIIEAFCTFLFVISLLYTMNFQTWKQYVDGLSTSWLRSILIWSTNSSFLLCGYAIMAMLLVWLLYVLIQTQKSRSLFKKISVQGNEIEIFEQSDDSYFDKYLNEVLYLFENSGADVVVFEDMDRYNVNQIFQRLREVNTLVNNQREQQGKAPIRFFYLLRDDIFVSKDRTKFFDFIIPVVPILDGSNSYDQFIAHFKSGGIFQLFDKNFLQGISLYVDDMRILKNIYNEFVIYNKRIGTTEQNANKLLALIAYKNLFPRDFSDLQLNKGFVFSIFNSKDKFIAEKKSILSKEIEEHNTKIKEILSEVLTSDSEIDAVYSSAPYIDYYGHTQNRFISVRDSRKKNLHLRADGEIERIKVRISQIQNQIIALQNSKLSGIIDRENIESIFRLNVTNEIGEVNEFKEIKSSDYFDLLKYLIRNGFIDETYPDYMTYFYENSLSRVDKVFLRSVTDQKAKEYTYSLKRPDMVISRLRVVDFESQETLNFDLLCFLLQNHEQYMSQLTNLLLQLKTAKKYDFIIQFVEVNREVPTFIQVINHQWPQLFETILNESDYSSEQKKSVALLSLYFSPNDDIEAVNSNNALSNFISHQSDFLQIKEPQTEALINRFELLHIQFVALNYSISNVELWREVYSHNLYELNWKMIKSILENQYKIPQSDKYNHRNFSLVLSSTQEPLVSYIEANINKYFELIFAHCDGKISDNENVVVHTLNIPSLDDKYKKKYIDALSTKLSSLKNIENTMWWTQIVDSNLLLYSENNVLRYFFGMGKKYDNTLVQFINTLATSYSFDGDVINKEFGEDSNSEFFTETVKCNNLQNNKYKAILHSLQLHYNSFSLENIDEDKINILIDLCIIRMTPEALIFMRKHYPHQVLYFIAKNPKVYVDNTLDKNSFLMDEALDVLQSAIESVYKVTLLKFTDEAISVQKTRFEADVEAYILEHNFSKDDLPYLLQSYDKLSTSSQNATERLAKTYIQDITTNEYTITYTLLLKLLRDTSLDRETRLNVFSYSVSDLDQIQCRNCFEALDAYDYLSIFDGKRPKIAGSDANKRILETFQHNSWITKYEIDKEGYYRAIGRKLHAVKKLPTELL